MNRQRDIFEKIDYCNWRFTQFGNTIHDAGMEGTNVAHIGLMAADLLSYCREIFDYCALDIIETKVAPKEPKIAKALASGSLRCYYPFYTKQLTDTNKPFSCLQQHDNRLYKKLTSIVNDIDTNQPCHGTLIKMSILREMSDMVNHKKHDKLLEVESKGGETLYHESNGFKVMTQMPNQGGMSLVAIHPGAKHKVGTNYVFEHNKKEIMKFTHECMTVSRMIMNEMYKSFLP